MARRVLHCSMAFYSVLFAGNRTNAESVSTILQLLVVLNRKHRIEKRRDSKRDWKDRDRESCLCLPLSLCQQSV